MVQVPDESNAFREGADDAFETILQAVSSDSHKGYSQLTKDYLILFIKNHDIHSFNASARLNDFSDLVCARLENPLSYGTSQAMWETTFPRNSHAGLGRQFYEQNILLSMG